MIRFVYDMTFKLEATPTLTAQGSQSNTSVATISMNNLKLPFVTSHGTWTPQVSGGDTQSVQGLQNWLYDSGNTVSGRYSKYVVLGSRCSATASNLSTAVTAPATIAVNSVFGIHKRQATADIGTTTTFPAIAVLPYTSMQNSIGSGSNVNTPKQNASISSKYSAKRWEGVTDVKDVSALSGTYTSAPTEGGKWEIFMAPKLPVDGGQHLDQIVRIKVEYLALLTDVVTDDNDPLSQGGTQATMQM